MNDKGGLPAIIREDTLRSAKVGRKTSENYTIPLMFPKELVALKIVSK